MAGKRQTLFVLVAALYFLPWQALPAMAQGAQIGQALNAIGTLVVVRPDGTEVRLQDRSTLQIFEEDVLRTETASQALIEFRNGIQVALSGNTALKIVSRWERAKGITPILRLKQGEIWVKTGRGSKLLEAETPVAVAAVQGAEFDMKVLEGGKTVLTVIEGMVEFGTPLGTCPVSSSMVSYGARGHGCTKPVSADVKPVVAWTQVLLR